MQINFPNKYPSPGFPPVFHFGLGTSLDSVLSVNLMRLLKATANDRTKKSRPCMEVCLRRLVLALEVIKNGYIKLTLNDMRFKLSISLENLSLHYFSEI